MEEFPNTVNDEEIYDDSEKADEIIAEILNADPKGAVDKLLSCDEQTFVSIYNILYEKIFSGKCNDKMLYVHIFSILSKTRERYDQIKKEKAAENGGIDECDVYDFPPNVKFIPAEDSTLGSTNDA